MKTHRFILVLALAVIGGACGTDESIEDAATSLATTTTAATTQAGVGQGMGMSAGMQSRHQATIPADYRDLTNPVAADEESLARGAEIYATCAVCHGETGLGDGAAGAALDPAPVNIAHTSQMMSDAYLFWRISEGGAAFSTAMPAWKDALSEQEMWDVINYVQALGEGLAVGGPGSGMGMGQGMGQGGNARAQAVQQTALLQIAVDQGVITQEESDAFETIHPLVDARVAELRGTVSSDVMLQTALTDLVGAGDLTQAQADTFESVHEALSAAGLLP